MNTQTGISTSVVPIIVSVTIDLFGHARAVAGVRAVSVTLPALANAKDIAAALAEMLPQLAGTALTEDGTAFQTSYTANLNGLNFLSDTPVELLDGDRIFVFSSQAGG